MHACPKIVGYKRNSHHEVCHQAHASRYIRDEKQCWSDLRFLDIPDRFVERLVGDNMTLARGRQHAGVAAAALQALCQFQMHRISN